MGQCACGAKVKVKLVFANDDNTLALALAYPSVTLGHPRTYGSKIFKNDETRTPADRTCSGAHSAIEPACERLQARHSGESLAPTSASRYLAFASSHDTSRSTQLIDSEATDVASGCCEASALCWWEGEQTSRCTICSACDHRERGGFGGRSPGTLLVVPNFRTLWER